MLRILLIFSAPLAGVGFGGDSGLAQDPAGQAPVRPTSTSDAPPQPSAVALETTRRDEIALQIIQATNLFREGQQLSTLTSNLRLGQTAYDFAHFMASTQKYGHHADGRTPAERANAHQYDYCIVLENIAWRHGTKAFTADELAKGFVEGWQNSPPHRRAMLDDEIVETAVAVVGNEKNAFYAVQLFGLPKSAQQEFQIVNQTAGEVQYRLKAGDRNESFQLAPRTTRTHFECHRAQIEVAGSPELIGKVTSGVKYLLTTGDNQQLSVERKAIQDDVAEPDADAP
ncbi:CAP domain-containing protein [Lignipirellula cremea]|uniref:Cysteine-rich secretory protein family protein n=1 Tax=Lignipirellula cremea TaxID=2528010 RepID=A0A518DS62_9BACT|nr:CAP domain-containing protein [Lignipirellula cremea]QDU94674.1 Cysteine-rich secretory protein family protein [Lignipirellula cremea]